jgi:diaminopimelate epimerase
MIRFAKAHACGNDFLIVERDSLDQGSIALEDLRALAIALCTRNTGVGADGVEFLTWTGERSASIRLFNADGSMAEISGNGTRCIAAWIAHVKNAQAGESIEIATDAGPRECRLIAATGDGVYEIAARMGVPKVEPGTVFLDEEGIAVEGVKVSTGNPHFVIFVEDESFRAHGLEWRELGRSICFHPDFPRQINVEFVHVRSAGEIAIRIFERGVGPTSSSGTGTCATAAAAIATRGCASRLVVQAPGGVQRTEWHGPTEEILLTGPAVIIAQGEAFLRVPEKAPKGAHA